MFWKKGHKIIDAEKLNNFLKGMIKDSFTRNFIAYKIAEYENEIIKDGPKPDYYTKGGCTTYTEGVDPEVTCWHCKKTFLCDCCDATCRLCGAPFAKERCEEFKFVPKYQEDDYITEGMATLMVYFAKYGYVVSYGVELDLGICIGDLEGMIDQIDAQFRGFME